jgi:hypothetical protein
MKNTHFFFVCFVFIFIFISIYVLGLFSLIISSSLGLFGGAILIVIGMIWRGASRRQKHEALSSSALLLSSNRMKPLTGREPIPPTHGDL